MTTGADLLVSTALANGIDHCFANPGTTELHLVEALDRADGMRSVLCAFEGVASGAADAFARVSGRPALGLFHLGPGLANALANLHNARRHTTPMVNLIGDQASWHLAADAPLTSDIAKLTSWVGRQFDVTSPDDGARAMADAVHFARNAGGAGRISSVVLPADHAWGPATATPATADIAAPTDPDSTAVAAGAAALRLPGAILLLDGARIDAPALRLADAIGGATGCRVLTNRAPMIEFGVHVPVTKDLPYFAGPLHAALADVSVAVLTGAGEPVTFFGYPDRGSHPLPETAERLHLGSTGAPLGAILEALCGELGLEPTEGAGRSPDPLPPIDPGALTTVNLGTAFAAAIPEGAIVVGESITSGATYRSLAPSAAPHTMLGVTGGAIGGGLPAAVGAAVAAPDRPVLSLQADGSALYTIQSLWTMAREQLDVTIVICANGTYNILDVELQQAGIELSGSASNLTSLGSPAIDFASLAAGFGVPAVHVSTGAELEAALARAGTEQGPNLIQAQLTT